MYFYRYIYIYNIGRFVNYVFKPLICKYRTHAHNLNMETGRYLKIDKKERICNLCNDMYIEDEFHFILKFTKYEDICKMYIKPYYWKKTICF